MTQPILLAALRLASTSWGIFLPAPMETRNHDPRMSSYYISLWRLFFYLMCPGLEVGVEEEGEVGNWDPQCPGNFDRDGWYP